MKFTAKTYYALVAASELARHHGGAPQRAGAVAEKYGIPARFLELTLNELVSAGVAGSKRGAEGGFFLKNNPEEIRVFDIVSAIEGNITIFDCEKLSDSGECMFSEYMGGLRAAIEEYLKNTNLKELSDSAGNGLDALNYVI